MQEEPGSSGVQATRMCISWEAGLQLDSVDLRQGAVTAGVHAVDWRAGSKTPAGNGSSAETGTISSGFPLRCRRASSSILCRPRPRSS